MATRRFVVEIETEATHEDGHDEFGNDTNSNVKYLAYVMEVSPNFDTDEQIQESGFQSGSPKQTIGESFESALVHYMLENQ